MKDHVKLNSCVYKGNLKLCKYRGLGMGSDFEMAPYCTKQIDYPDDVHKSMDCKNCPDYREYEYTVESTNNIIWEGTSI